MEAGAGRDLIGREVEAIDQLVTQYGTPEIKVGEARFAGDTRRPVLLTWVIDGQPKELVVASAAPPEKPRNLVRKQLERHAREHGGTILTETHRIGLDGRRPIVRRVELSSRREADRTPSGTRLVARHRLVLVSVAPSRAQLARACARATLAKTAQETLPNRPRGATANTRCGADISHLGPLAYHCDNA